MFERWRRVRCDLGIDPVRCEANAGAGMSKTPAAITILPIQEIDPLFEATVQATEEAVINAMVAADTITGIDNHRVEGLPHDKLREVLKKYNRLVEAQ